MNHAVPLEVKRRNGNPGKRALPDINSTVSLPAANGIPPVPDSLGEVGAVAWERVWSTANTWVSLLEVELVLRYCEQLDLQRGLIADIERYGTSIEDKDGFPKMNPAVSALDKLNKTLLAYERELYLTPPARSRAGAGEIKQASAIEKFLEDKKRRESERSDANDVEGNED
jgi:P27 family predicted phage terminase small subunit